MFLIIIFSLFDWSFFSVNAFWRLKHSVVVKVDEAFRQVPSDAECDDVEDDQRCHRVQENFCPLQNIESAENIIKLLIRLRLKKYSNDL